ncbi:hypothetical protein MTR67_048460 [Solanum verrucosum]|uniref:Tf2-1-like SH3-like domain-containing protein n=1 Tax=Solanum verrucosum TaxID=315347 RepID=A0AAF0UYF6_SOLVR|nr:hypothetical protein MTR67_048460 [Solanum verrucosum]
MQILRSCRCNLRSPSTDYPRSVDQTTVCGLCPWIKTSFTQPLTRTTVDQHGPSLDPRSVGLTVDRRFRFSVSRSRLDRFPIFSSAESIGLGIKVERRTDFHPQTIGQAERAIQTLEDMLRACVIDFKGEIALIGPELIYQAIEKVRLIRERLGMAQSRQKSYANIAYELDLPIEFALVHPVFHVSMLKKCIGVPVSIILLEGSRVDVSLSYEEVSVKIIDRQVKRLRNKEIASVNVLWRNHLVEGATWEIEADIKSQYPHLFPYTPIQA